jgi:hypothetical protein
MDTKKLFHAIVVIGMTTAAACSSSSPNPGDDASADASTGNDTGTKDVTTTPDTGGGKDATGDGFVAWIGC